jgi:MoxR-like ATPase
MTAPPLARLHKIEAELNAGQVERAAVIRAALIALVSKSHVVLLGPPGSAKSRLVTEIAARFCGASGHGLRLFVYLLTRFTEPAEIFGPVSVGALKDDVFRRVTTGKLPEAQLVFLDEVFKSSSALLNSLLTLMNERTYDNGGLRQAVPLISVFAASNEMPEGNDLAALWDRFLLRLQVDYVSETGFEQLLAHAIAAPGDQDSPPPATLAREELAAVQNYAAHLPVAPGLIGTLRNLRHDLKQQHGIEASDRRWVQALSVLRAHAVLEGRDAVTEEDLGVLSDILWTRPEERGDIARLIARLRSPAEAQADELRDQATSAWHEARSTLRQPAGALGTDGRAHTLIDALERNERISRQLQTLLDQAREQGSNTTRVERALEAVEKIKTEIIAASDY